MITESPNISDFDIYQLSDEEFEVLLYWMSHISIGSKELLDILPIKTKELEKALEFIEELSKSDEIRAKCRSREKAMRDRLTRIETAYENGFEEGKQKAKENVKEKMAHNLLREGMDIAFVAKVTGLSMPEVMELSKT